MFSDKKNQIPNDTFSYRYGATGDPCVPDRYLRAWTMLRASGSMGVSFLNRKHQQKECRQYMEDLQLFSYETASEDEKEQFRIEWQAFARYFIATCTGSKTYCSTLFGMIPVKDHTVARKIAEEIVFVTRTFPAQLGLSEQFAPLHEVMADAYRTSIEDGETYWASVSPFTTLE